MDPFFSRRFPSPHSGPWIVLWTSWCQFLSIRNSLHCNILVHSRQSTEPPWSDLKYDGFSTLKTSLMMFLKWWSPHVNQLSSLSDYFLFSSHIFGPIGGDIIKYRVVRLFYIFLIIFYSKNRVYLSVNGGGSVSPHSFPPTGRSFIILSRILKYSLLFILIIILFLLLFF